MNNLPDDALKNPPPVEQPVSRYQLAIQKKAALLKDAAKNGKQIHWTIHDGHLVKETPGQFIADFIPHEILQLAYGAWLADDPEPMAKHFHSACEIAFDNAVQFLADKES